MLSLKALVNPPTEACGTALERTPLPQETNFGCLSQDNSAPFDRVCRYAQLAKKAICALGGRAKVTEIYAWIIKSHSQHEEFPKYWKVRVHSMIATVHA